MHGFCTDFARFQNVQRVLFVAKSDKGCRNYRVKNHVALFKNNDDSKLPEIETNRRLALLISGPRVRVPEDAPNFERQIVRFGVLSFSRHDDAVAQGHVLDGDGREQLVEHKQPPFESVRSVISG